MLRRRSKGRRWMRRMGAPQSGQGVTGELLFDLVS